MPVCRWMLPWTLGALGAVEQNAWILHQADPADFSWDERLAAMNDPGLMPSFSRYARPVSPGWWGWRDLRLRAGSHGMTSWIPGDPPIYEGGQAVSEGLFCASSSWGFLRLRALALIALGDGNDRVPHGDPRRSWTHQDENMELEPFDGRLRATVGVPLFWHLLALSNEPFRWGEGIFGGIVAGGGWEGPPHLVLTPQRPWSLGRCADEDFLLSYELFSGILDDGRQGPDHPTWTGIKVAGRWSWLALSWSLAQQANGSGNRRPNLGLMGTKERETDSSNAINSLMSVGLGIDLPADLHFGCEYGLDDRTPKDQRRAGWEDLDQFGPLAAAWTFTLDWLDVTGNQDLRLAVEWFRSESYFYDHHVFDAWDYDQGLLGHPDGGNANALRLLAQIVPAEGHQVALVLQWRRYGWRNAEDDNPNSGKNRSSSPGGPRFAALPWDQYGLFARYSLPLDRNWRLQLEGGLAYESNRRFEDGADGSTGYLGLGIRYDY